MDELGTFERRGDGVDLRYERHYPRPIETVWAALTEPARLADWVGPALVEPRLGGRYELFIDRPRPMTGRILTWEPPRLLEFSWDTGDAPANVVRCELAPDGDGTRLIFMHKGIGFVWIGLVLPGWHTHLERLASLLAGEAQPLSRPRWRALQAIYLERYKLEGVMLDPPPGHGG
ncbi:MAG: SRPBCC family protein [Alphaproteobacteria bacterium]